MGISEEKLTAVLDYADSPLLDEKEKLVLEYADQVTTKAGGVDAELLSKIKATFSPPEIVELTMAICVFQVFNRCNDILGADIDLPKAPDVFYRDTHKKS